MSTTPSSTPDRDLVEAKLDTYEPDVYEMAHMAGGDTLFREKMPMPALVTWGFPLFFILVGVLVLVTVPVLYFSVPFALLMLACAVFMNAVATLRVSVTEQSLHIQAGAFGPRIPVDAIERCEATTYDALAEYGGWGIRRGADGSWCYNVLGDDGKGVRVHYRDDGGEEKKIVFSSRHPHVLSDQINRLRLEKGHDVSGELAPGDEEVGLVDPFGGLVKEEEAVEVVAEAAKRR